MPAPTNHDLRDAVAAAYAEIGLEIGKVRRRWFEEAKAHIATRIAELEASGQPIDGTAVGREAFQVAANRYLLGEDDHPAIDGEAAAAAALASGEGS